PSAFWKKMGKEERSNSFFSLELENYVYNLGGHCGAVPKDLVFSHFHNICTGCFCLFARGMASPGACRH
ncbi:uncharacterized protein METZ01_LOCUS291021, partial [marine metagenome]